MSRRRKESVITEIYFGSNPHRWFFEIIVSRRDGLVITSDSGYTTKHNCIAAAEYWFRKLGFADAPFVYAEVSLPPCPPPENSLTHYIQEEYPDILREYRKMGRAAQ